MRRHNPTLTDDALLVLLLAGGGFLLLHRLAQVVPQAAAAAQQAAGQPFSDLGSWANHAATQGGVAPLWQAPIDPRLAPDVAPWWTT